MRVVLNEGFDGAYIDSRNSLSTIFDNPPNMNTSDYTESYSNTNFLITYPGSSSDGTWEMLVYGSMSTVPTTTQTILNGTYGDVNYTATSINYRLNGSDISILSEFSLDLNSVLNPSATGDFYSLSGSDTILGGGGTDYLDGHNGIDYLYGRSGNDGFFDTDIVNTDYLYGGDGNDVFFFNNQKKSDWTINKTSRDDLEDGTYYLINQSGYLNYFNSVEKIVFSDGTLRMDFDAGDSPGQAYRLYQAAFARTPDLPGVKYHLNDMEVNGFALENIANNFMASPEFKTKYGEDPSDDVFINLLYQNVLSRTPADSEVNWYKDQFEAGSMTRAAALIGFAESPENVSLVASQIEDGICLAS